MVLVGEPLNLESILAVARHGRAVGLSQGARERLERCRAYVERLLREGRRVYGVTTGFGRLAQVRIPPSEVRSLQRNLLLSHAMGVGENLPQDVVRAMLLLRAQSLALGYSGVRPELVELLLEMLNRGVHPVVPAQGSVGASGDLAPLAHLALPLLGEGFAEYAGEVLPGGEALRRAGLSPIGLEAKEGLALINGTQAMTALGLLTLADALSAAKVADVALAMSLEAIRGSLRPFFPQVFRLRPHPGAARVGENVLKLCQGSEIMRSHENCPKVQDPYSFRAAPQVHGASRDALEHALEVLLREANAVTDNPLLFPEEDLVLSAGNFHGQPVALAMDYAKIALAELASISERRTEKMLDPAFSGLPAFLAVQGGLHSGLMISQYTAASLVSENKVLAHPASVDSIPTSANQEDHVSMGTTAARHARMVLENLRHVLAIEVRVALEALEYRRPLRAGRGVEAVRQVLREAIPPLKEDRFLALEHARVHALLFSGDLLARVEAAVGPLA